ncbi:MAG: helix-turn-helix transcriptional regulator [Acidobacteria bacterium]|nr:helix-turn-helix transcriptional regulator [Acidobacteriota bacterium]
MGIDHSTLSQLLRGRRAFSKTSIQRLAIRLGVDNEAGLACRAGPPI